MRKAAYLILILSILFAFTGCGESTQPSGSSSDYYNDIYDSASEMANAYKEMGDMYKESFSAVKDAVKDVYGIEDMVEEKEPEQKETAESEEISELIMPNVTDKDLDTATEELISLGLSNIRWVPSDITNKSEWIVDSQNVKPGEPIDFSKDIILNCSKNEDKQVIAKEEPKEKPETEAKEAETDNDSSEKQSQKTEKSDSEDYEIETHLIKGTSVENARKYLDSIGYKATFTADNTGMDFTDGIYNSAFDGVFVVERVDSINPNSKTVHVYILGKDTVKQQEKSTSDRDKLDEKLYSGSAWKAAEKYGKKTYGSFKLHSIMGKMAEEAVDENTWFLKATCSYTFMGDKLEGTCEARVTGTDADPQVTSFIVY